MDVIGEQILQIIIEEQCLEQAEKLGLVRSYIFDEAGKAFEYLCTTIRTSKRYPTLGECTSKFRCAFSQSPSKADLVPLCEAARKRYALKCIGPRLERAASAFEKGELDGGFEALREALGVQETIGGLEIHSFKDDAPVRMGMYLERKAGGVPGLPSLWPSLNSATGGGWMDGWLHVIVGLSSVGKSWALSIIASCLTELIDPSECILVVTMEMSPERVARRVDCVKFKLPFLGMRDGELEESVEDDWLDKIANLPTSAAADIKFASRKQVKSVADIVRLCRMYHPRAVLIDGGYRLASSSARGEWVEQVGIIEALQVAARDEYPVPWIVTSQLNPAKEKGKKAGQDWRNMDEYSVRYAREWLIDPDLVIALQQNDDLVMLDQMEWVLFKVRDGSGTRSAFRTNWKRDTMEYDEVINPHVQPGQVQI